MSVIRTPKNPIITPKDIKPSRSDFEVIGSFNAGVTRLGDEIILLLRVAEKPVSRHPDVELVAFYDTAGEEIVLKEFSKSSPNIDFSDPRLLITPAGKFLTSLSHFRVARSKDGTNFVIDQVPSLFPATSYESFGLEDPRITNINGTYYISYVTVSPVGITTSLASTKDFKTFDRHGVIFCPDNKDVVLFPERIGGEFYALHRPVSPLFDKYEIWLAESQDLKCWGNHRYLMGLGQNHWDRTKIGAGAPPFRTNAGWLEVYHGADINNRYCLGAVLLDAEQPWKIIGRAQSPILQPQADYETTGFFGSVVFTCGLLYEQDKLKIYYGVADTSIAYAEIPLTDIMQNLNLP